MNEITDFIAGAMIQIGNLFKIRKNRFGWLISIACTCYWVYRGLSLGLQAQSFWHFVSLCLAVYGFHSWSKNDNT